MRPTDLPFEGTGPLGAEPARHRAKLSRGQGSESDPRKLSATPEKRIGYPVGLAIMQVQIARWGNSLGLRVPKEIAVRLGLKEGARVDINTRGKQILISVARPIYELDELLEGMTPEAIREAFDWGEDRGREIVE